MSHTPRGKLQESPLAGRFDERADGPQRVAFFSFHNPFTAEEDHTTGDPLTIAAALARLGMETHVFTPGPTAGHQTLAGVNCHVVACQADSPRADGTRSESNVLERAARFEARAAEACAKVAGTHGPFDVAHAFDWMSAAAALRARRDGAQTAVLTLDSTEYERAGRRFAPGISESIRQAECDAVWGVDHVVAANESVRQELVWLYELPPSNVHLLHAGIEGASVSDPSMAKAVKAGYGFNSAHPMCLYLGDLTVESGAGLMLSAITEIVRAKPQTGFLFAGEGPMREALAAEAAMREVGDRIRMPGHLAGAKLAEALGAADVAVFPGFTRNTLRVVLRAWAAGVPVVVSRTGPAEIVFNEVNGLLAFPNAHSIASAVVRILDNEAFATRLAQAGRARALDAFSPEAVARKLRDIYRS